jgi:hypothetical protein
MKILEKLIDLVFGVESWHDEVITKEDIKFIKLPTLVWRVYITEEEENDCICPDVSSDIPIRLGLFIESPIVKHKYKHTWYTFNKIDTDKVYGSSGFIIELPKTIIMKDSVLKPTNKELLEVREILKQYNLEKLIDKICD